MCDLCTYADTWKEMIGRVEIKKKAERERERQCGGRESSSSIIQHGSASYGTWMLCLNTSV